jgi:predicted protein tyrosine phosphatase
MASELASELGAHVGTLESLELTPHLPLATGVVPLTKARRAARVRELYAAGVDVPSEILPGRLWVGGGASHAYDPRVMKAMGFTHVLNCAIELDALQYPVPLTATLHLSLDDDELNLDRPRAGLRLGADTIREWLRDDGAVVLVHCFAGISRSVSAVAAYLVLHVGMSTQRALDLIKEQRPIAGPYCGFVQVLREFEAERGAAARDLRAAARAAAREGAGGAGHEPRA